jgi:hypothetical protein
MGEDLLARPELALQPSPASEPRDGSLQRCPPRGSARHPPDRRRDLGLDSATMYRGVRTVEACVAPRAIRVVVTSGREGDLSRGPTGRRARGRSRRRPQGRIEETPRRGSRPSICPVRSADCSGFVMPVCRPCESGRGSSQAAPGGQTLRERLPGCFSARPRRRGARRPEEGRGGALGPDVPDRGPENVTPRRTVGR